MSDPVGAQTPNTGKSTESNVRVDKRAHDKSDSSMTTDDERTESTADGQTVGLQYHLDTNPQLPLLGTNGLATIAEESNRSTQVVSTFQEHIPRNSF